MNIWDEYAERMELHGSTRREAAKVKLEKRLEHKAKDTLSFHTAIIDGEERELTIINSDNFDEKTLITLPGETLRMGAYVEWMEQHWLITSKDFNTEIYTKAKMEQCNYLLRWIQSDGTILERWSIVNDGTKYMTGEYGDRDFIMNRGDSRIQLYLPIDEETLKLTREQRFLIDAYGANDVLSYRLSKPVKLGGSFDNNGVMAFVLQEVNSTDDDNFELHIADYYKYYPKPGETAAVVPVEPGDTERKGRKVWL